MCRPPVFIFLDAFVGTGAELEDHFLEFTDHEHRLVHFEDLVFRNRPVLQLVLDHLAVGVTLNRLEFDRLLLEIRSQITVIIAHFFFSIFVKLFESAVAMKLWRTQSAKR